MRFSKLLIVGMAVVATLNFTGCTPYERGLTTGVVVGAVGTNYYYNGYNYGPNRSTLYRRGVRDGCRSARGHWTKRMYDWNHYRDYRNGWRAGYNRCRR